jgi:hypothetical protein
VVHRIRVEAKLPRITLSAGFVWLSFQAVGAHVLRAELHVATVSRMADEPEGRRTLDELIRDGMRLVRVGGELPASREAGRLSEWAEQPIAVANATGRNDVAHVTQTVIDDRADTRLGDDIASRSQRDFVSSQAGKRVISQAQGIIMVRFQVDSERALELLCELSKKSGLRVSVIAQQVVHRKVWRQ